MTPVSVVFLVGAVVGMCIWIGSVATIVIRAAVGSSFSRDLLRLVALGVGITAVFSSLLIVSVAVDRGLALPVVAIAMIPAFAIGIGAMAAAFRGWLIR